MPGVPQLFWNVFFKTSHMMIGLAWVAAFQINFLLWDLCQNATFPVKPRTDKKGFSACTLVVLLGSVAVTQYNYLTHIPPPPHPTLQIGRPECVCELQGLCFRNPQTLLNNHSLFHDLFRLLTFQFHHIHNHKMWKYACTIRKIHHFTSFLLVVWDLKT